MSIVGLDLAGVESRPTGFCILRSMKAETFLAYANQEILKKTEEIHASIVAIDAPLSLPPGRKSIEERTGEHLRESDRELLRRRIRFFPITLGPMRKLTTRGIQLRHILESMGFKVIEVYPGGAQDVLGIPRKQQGLDKLKAGLENLSIRLHDSKMTDHELDAITCAYVGKLFLDGESITHGDPSEGIVMPQNRKRI